MAGKKRLYRSVLEGLEKLIDDGDYPPGSRLPPERELAERFGVGRPTIREAIIALETLKKVEVKTGSGVYVLDAPSRGIGIDYSSVSAFELTEARALIEGEAAALAATMISDEQLQELEAVLNEMADESADGELISEQADQKFHHIISTSTQNNMLLSIIDNLWYVRDNSPTVHAACQAICTKEPHARFDEHKDILDALKLRDPNAAREAMHAHFVRILNKLITTTEQAQVDEIRRKASESRERFSLNHLAANE